MCSFMIVYQANVLCAYLAGRMHSWRYSWTRWTSSRRLSRCPSCSCSLRPTSRAPHSTSAPPLTSGVCYNLLVGWCTLLYPYSMENKLTSVINWSPSNTWLRRPTFSYFRWELSILGALSSLLMSTMIAPFSTLLSALVFLILLVSLSYRQLPHAGQWGSISQALIFAQVRRFLLLLDARKDHVRLEHTRTT